MEKIDILKVTREKHLDHMVKVVPFIVFCYGVHSYILLNLGKDPLSTKGIIVLGGLLALMIIGLVLYDIKHQVELDHERVKISFFGKMKVIKYQDILNVEVVSPGETFSTLKLLTANGTYHLFFIDEAEKIKTLIVEKQSGETKKAA
jgi:hypothetical protein